MEWPVQKLTAQRTWDDLALAKETRSSLAEIEAWLKQRAALGGRRVAGRVSPGGCRALFRGPSGTGKTMAAALVGVGADREVYRVDLSRVVSKYIGETEKNLAGILNRAEAKSWILFFDEADALFSRRTDVRDAGDRFGNQQTNFLLQRLETFGGLAILSTNFKGSIDPAFLRRFQWVIQFA